MFNHLQSPWSICSSVMFFHFTRFYIISSFNRFKISFNFRLLHMPHLYSSISFRACSRCRGGGIYPKIICVWHPFVHLWPISFLPLASTMFCWHCSLFINGVRCSTVVRILPCVARVCSTPSVVALWHRWDHKRPLSAHPSPEVSPCLSFSILFTFSLAPCHFVAYNEDMAVNGDETSVFYASNFNS